MTVTPLLTFLAVTKSASDNVGTHTISSNASVATGVQHLFEYISPALLCAEWCCMALARTYLLLFTDLLQGAGKAEKVSVGSIAGKATAQLVLALDSVLDDRLQALEDCRNKQLPAVKASKTLYCSQGECTPLEFEQAMASIDALISSEVDIINEASYALHDATGKRVSQDE